MKRTRSQRHRQAAATPGRRFASLAGILGLAALALAIWRWQPAAPEPAPLAENFTPPAPLPQPQSPFLNTRPAAQYVGTERCTQCHADEHATYLHTAHSRSMSPVDPAQEPPDGQFEHPASGRRYQVYRAGGRLRQSESLLVPGGQPLPLADHALTYLVGSGRFSRTYLAEDDGFLIESPATWYASLGSWAMSPGYDEAEHPSFHRTAKYECLYCHAGQLAASPAAGERVRIVETAIGCERCHGPGSLHTARWEGSTGGLPPEGDRTIVNPKRLPRELAESICHQCHLTGEVQVAVRGRGAAAFRPGLRWQDFAIDYGFETASADMTVVGHVGQMQASRCYQASERLTCLTCHAGHEAADPAGRPARQRDNCQQCHAEPSCGVPLGERTATSDNNCAACHMPQSPTDIPHIAFTHHRIGIHRAVAAPRAASAEAFRPLVPVLDVSHLPETDRQQSLGLAYLQYHRDHQEGKPPAPAAYLAAAAPLIQASVQQGLLDARTMLAQAQLSQAAGDMSAARRLAQQTLAAVDVTLTERTLALRFLGGDALQRGDVEQARAHLEALTALVREPPDWFLLGVCRQRQGDLPGAVAAFERVLSIDPAQAETYDMLAPLYTAQGQREREAWSREQAQRIRAARESRGGPVLAP